MSRGDALSRAGASRQSVTWGQNKGWRFEPSPASQLPLRAEMRFGPGSAEAAFHPCAIPTKAGGDDRVVDRAVNSRSCRQFMCVQPQVLTRFRTAFFSNRARFAPQDRAVSRRAKIVCTLGPSSPDLPSVRHLVESGMDVVRLNLSHGTHEEHAGRFEWVREVGEETVARGSGARRPAGSEDPDRQVRGRSRVMGGRRAGSPHHRGCAGQRRAGVHHIW